MTFSCDRVALHAALVLVNKLAGPSVASALLVASEDGALTVAAGSPAR